MTTLPIEASLPELRRAMAQARCAVLQAPPGAGKTTLVPLSLLHEPWLDGRRIVMLEPRRLAARAAATRMAALLGEEVGQTVGYRMRMASRVGRQTRIEVVTEGILTRRLQSDPELEGVGAVIFDEFHERSLNADLGLALCLEVREALREDLRLLVMSATLDGVGVARLLGDAPVIVSDGRSFPVETRQLGEAPTPAGIAPAVAAAVRRALAEQPGDILAFLPGEAEIRRAAAILRDGGLDDGITLAPLYGALPQHLQDIAIRPSPPGHRKVVLATSIAETSLTIEGVRVVIDSGGSRMPRFDPRRGLTRLETVRVSRAAADQRRGRAGRLGPGTCYRLWSAAEDRLLQAFDPPEIRNADLAALALELAAWGATDPDSLAWLDPPPAAAFTQARDLLIQLGALDAAGRATEHGRRMAALPMHPRLAHMVLRAKTPEHGGTACDLAALLSERDILRGAGTARDTDLRLRLELLHAPAEAVHLPDGLTLDAAARQAVRRIARHWRDQTGTAQEPPAVEACGMLIALAFPDRTAQRRGPGLYRLSSGRGAVLPAGDPLAAADWLGVAALDAGAQDARIFLAAPVDPQDIRQIFADAIQSVDLVEWDSREEVVAARRQERLEALILRDVPLPDPPTDRVLAALLAGIRGLGIEALPWTPEHRQWQARVRFVAALDGPEGGWPEVADDALLRRLEDWLSPYLAGTTRRGQLARVDLGAALQGQLSWEQRRRLDEEAPTRLPMPSGSRRTLDYRSGEPVLAVRLQEMFGTTATPRIARGRVPVTLHLLSPAGRPVQVTRDLASFWANAYHEVKRDLRGRYPKHHWPDDPLAASPTARAKSRAG